MKIKKLIEELSKLPQDKEIGCLDIDSNIDMLGAYDIDITSIKDINKEDYDIVMDSVNNYDYFV